MNILGKQFPWLLLFFLLFSSASVVWRPLAITDIVILHFSAIFMNLTHIWNQ